MRAVHEDFFELEAPLVLGVINDALIERFFDVNVDVAKLWRLLPCLLVDVKLLVGEVGGGAHADEHFDWAFFHSRF